MPTWHDDTWQVHMSMRILTDEGEEKDLYQIMPEETDEEKWRMPKQMQCSACQAVAYQAAVAVDARLKRRHNDELIGIVTLEAIQELCSDVQHWTNAYGIQPTKAGYNVYEGDGVEMPKDDVFTKDDAVMTSKKHSDTAAKKLADVCHQGAHIVPRSPQRLVASALLTARVPPCVLLVRCAKGCCLGLMPWRRTSLPP